jgi:hypothetical protein
MSEKAEKAEKTEIVVFVEIENGEICSISSNVADLDVMVIDRDLEEVDEEVFEQNTELDKKMTDMQNNGVQLFEYIESALETEDNAVEDSAVDDIPDGGNPF